jgi:hypothetical protein
MWFKPKGKRKEIASPIHKMVITDVRAFTSTRGQHEACIEGFIFNPSGERAGIMQLGWCQGVFNDGSFFSKGLPYAEIMHKEVV